MLIADQNSFYWFLFKSQNVVIYFKKVRTECTTRNVTKRKFDSVLFSMSKVKQYLTIKGVLVISGVDNYSGFCKLRRNFGFFCSVNPLSGPLRKHMFTCDWCISIHFVFFCVSRFAARDRPVSGNDRLVFFEAFYDLSYPCLFQA